MITTNAIVVDEDVGRGRLCYVRLNMAAMSRTDERLPTPASDFTESSPDGDRDTASGLVSAGPSFGQTQAHT